MESCIVCVEKHLGMADGYLQEARAGYQGRLGKALGQLALAEDEAADRFPEFTAKIRTYRKALEAQRQTEPGYLDRLLVEVEELAAGADPSLRKQSPADHARVIDPPLEEGDCPPECQERRRWAALARAAAQQVILAREPQGPQTIRRPAGAGSDEEIPQDGPKPILVLMTALADFSPGYSLTTVIKDQARAGVLAGYDVHLVTMEHTTPKKPKLEGVTFDPIIPNVVWKEDEVDDKKVARIREVMKGYLLAFFKEEGCNNRPVIVITHDFLLQTWYICAAKALHEIGDWFPQAGWALKWFHQIHSSVGPRPTHKPAQWRCTIPKGHRVMPVNWHDVQHLQKYYQADAGHFHTLPNIRAPEDFWGFSENAQLIARETGLAEAEVAQVYPVSTPRASAKGLDKVMHLFGIMKRDFGKKVCLVMANAHANGNLPMLQSLRQLAKGFDLEDEFHITSELIPTTGAHGLPMADVSALMGLANVFCFPSQSEACGLVMLEAALAGCILVLNDDLPVMHDFIQPSEALWAPWGSIRQNRPVDPRYWQTVAGSIISRLSGPPNSAKRRVLAHGTRYLAGELTKLLGI